jgi:SAM-dependent methyltransferase
MLNLVLLTLLLSLLIFVTIFWIFQISYTLSQDKIGFLPSLSGKLNMQLLRVFDHYLDETKEYSFVELGAGVANIAGMISKRFEFKDVIAVEIDPITVFFGKLLNNFAGTNVEFVRKDIFAYKIPSKSVLYCYLGTHIIEKLYQQGKFDGHLVVSTTFKLKEVEPVEVIEMNNFYMRMYVYDFRQKISSKKTKTIEVVATSKILPKTSQKSLSKPKKTKSPTKPKTLKKTSKKSSISKK